MFIFCLVFSSSSSVLLFSFFLDFFFIAGYDGCPKKAGHGPLGSAGFGCRASRLQSPKTQTIQAKRWVRQARASSCPAGPRVPLCSAGHCAVLARQSQGLWAPARFPPVTIWQGHRRRVAAHVCNHLADQPAQVAGRQVRGSTEQRKCEVIVQELCERRGGRPGLSVLTSLVVSVDVKQY